MAQTTKKFRKSAKKMRKRTKNVRVLACGTFDVLHPGHVFFLEQAKKLGDELFVIVARDKNVQRIKGTKPIFDEEARVQLVAALKCVDTAVLGNEEGSFFVKVKEINPNILAMGYDQRVGNIRERLEEHHLNVSIVVIKPLRQTKFKSTIIKEKIRATKK